MVFSKFFAPLFLNKPQSKCTFASNNCPGLLFDIDGIRFGNSLLFISRTSGYYIFLNIHKNFGKNSSFLFLRENWTKSIFIPLFWILSLRKYANFHMKIFIFPTKKNYLFTLTVIFSKKKLFFRPKKKLQHSYPRAPLTHSRSHPYLLHGGGSGVLGRRRLRIRDSLRLCLLVVLLGAGTGIRSRLCDVLLGARRGFQLRGRPEGLRVAWLARADRGVDGGGRVGGQGTLELYFSATGRSQGG